MPRTIGPAAVAVIACLAVTYAHPSYVAKNPNGANIPGVAAIGHTNPNGGGDTNSYGDDFSQYGGKWTRELCLADSDGDTFTNGFE